MSSILENYRKQTDYSYTSIGQTSYSTEINRYIDDLLGIIKLTGNPNATIDSYTILMLWSSPENKNKYTKIPVDITGIDYNKQDNRGRTALSCAIFNKNVSFFQWLLKNGSDPNTLAFMGSGSGKKLSLVDYLYEVYPVTETNYRYSDENIIISDKFINILIKYPKIVQNMNTKRKFDLVKRGILNIQEYPMILNDMYTEMKFDLVKRGILDIHEYPMIIKDMDTKMKFELVKRDILNLYTELSLSEKIDYFYKNKEPLYKLFGHDSTDYESMTTHDLIRLRFGKYDYVPEGAPLGLASPRGARNGPSIPCGAPSGLDCYERIPRPDSIKSFRLFLLKCGIIGRFFDSLKDIDLGKLILAIFECSPINKITIIDYVLGFKKAPQGGLSPIRAPQGVYALVQALLGLASPESPERPERPLNIIDSHFSEKNATAIIHLLSNDYYIPVLSKGSQKMIDFFNNRQIVSFIIEKSGIDLCSDISRIIVDYICGPKGPSGIKRSKGSKGPKGSNRTKMV